MSDVRRLLPDGFLPVYERTIGPVPESFLEAYELLCEVLYYGTRIREDTGRITGTGGSDYFFGEPRLLEPKARVDKHLAQTTAALRAWSVQGEGARARRARPADPRGRDLDRARGAGDHGPEREEAS